MTKPLRLTLSRRRGFDLQKLSQRTNGRTAVVVSRPSCWGNPYSLTAYARAKALALHRKDIQRKLKANPAFLAPLRGKNLACWCAPDVACHADTLLELANG